MAHGSDSPSRVIPTDESDVMPATADTKLTESYTDSIRMHAHPSTLTSTPTSPTMHEHSSTLLSAPTSPIVQDYLSLHTSATNVPKLISTVMKRYSTVVDPCDPHHHTESLKRFQQLITYTRDYFALPDSVPIIADILQDVESTDNPLVITNLQDPYAPADNTTYATPVDPKTWPETAKKLNQSLHVLVSCAFGGPLVSNLLDTHQSARL